MGRHQTTDLSRLKGGDGVKIELHSAEILSLFRELAELYRQHAAGGIPRRVTELVRVDSTIGQLASLTPDQVAAYLSANKVVGVNLISNLLTWAVELQEPEMLLPRLMALSPMVVRNLNAAVGLGALKQALRCLERP